MSTRQTRSQSRKAPPISLPLRSKLALRRVEKAKAKANTSANTSANTNIAYLVHARLLKEKIARLEDENNRLSQSWVLNLETDGDWLESLRSEGVVYAYEDGLEEFGVDNDGNLFFGKAQVALRSEERRRWYVNCNAEMRQSTRDMEMRFSRARISNEMLLRVNAEADAQLRLELMQHICEQQKPKAVTTVGKLLEAVTDWYEGRG